jgi:AcrR family transcriptional regulator
MMSDRTSVEERVSDKRTAILEATLDLISERGFHNISMSLIAKTSGVSTGIIYHYFASKEELISELYKKIKVEVSRATLVGYSEDLSFRERFLRMWFNVLHYAMYQTKETAFLEQFENSPYSASVLSEDFMDNMKCVHSFVVQGVKEDVFKDLPFDVLVELSIGVAVSLAKRHIAGAIVLDDELMQATADACWDAIRR